MRVDDVTTRFHWILRLVAAAASVGNVAGRCQAAVVVLANRTHKPVVVAAMVDALPAEALEIPAGDSRPIVAQAGVRVHIGPHGGEREFALDPDCAYYIGADPSGDATVIEQIGLGETAAPRWPATIPAASSAAKEQPPDSPAAGVVTVKILVDDHETRRRSVWEPLLRKRIADASEILAAHAGVRLQVVAVDAWVSDDGVTDFEQSLAEFERKVTAAPARLAIGFSSQYTILPGRTHVGGTRGPLRSHILVKERSGDVLEAERLELLVHELGHFLGAGHSPEPPSVMRPVLSDGLQRLTGARVQIDPVNTLLMSLVGQEIRGRRVRRLADVSPETRGRMGEIYAGLNPALPDDPAAGHLLAILAAANATPIIEDARQVLARIVEAGHARQADGHKKEIVAGDAAGGGGSESAPPAASGGDELLETYVRRAAIAAQQVRPDSRRRAFLLALGVAMDDAGALRQLPTVGGFEVQFEGSHERRARLAALGRPTMRGSSDLARDFFVAAHLAAILGAQTARSAPVLKALFDPHHGLSCSFDDIVANRAGLAFAAAVLDDRLSIDELARRFEADTFLPTAIDAQDKLGGVDFPADVSQADDSQLNDGLFGIDARLKALSIYQNGAASVPK